MVASYKYHLLNKYNLYYNLGWANLVLPIGPRLDWANEKAEEGTRSRTPAQGDNLHEGDVPAKMEIMSHGSWSCWVGRKKDRDPS